MLLRVNVPLRYVHIPVSREVREGPLVHVWRQCPVAYARRWAPLVSRVKRDLDIETLVSALERAAEESEKTR